jgi:cell division protein FtsB
VEFIRSGVQHADILVFFGRMAGTNLVQTAVKEFFHLTQISAHFQLRGMKRFNKSVKGLLSSIPGMGGDSRYGWHKIATVAAAALAVALGFHVIFGQNGLTAYEQKRQEFQTLELQLRSLQHQNDLLKGHVDRLQSDPDAIEHQAREDLHYTRPGEVIYALPSVTPAKK